MLDVRFDPHEPHPYVCYARMSDKSQNPRSPDQQLVVIESTLRSFGYPWVHVADYRDDAISGRYLGRRPGFQKMLRDIATGMIGIDLILVDERERFARADEATQIVTKLRERNGVLLLTADSSFSDPTSSSGRIVETIEQLRSVEETRIKSRRVLRGKRDAAMQRHWPGGPPPLGFKLSSVFIDRNGRQELAHSILVPDPKTVSIVVLIFQKAREGIGTPTLAKFLNENSGIPADLKPFYADSIGYMLDNPVYYGTLRWGRNATGIVNDTRRVVRNPDDKVLWIADFCEGIVSEETWKEAQRLRDERRRRKSSSVKTPGAKRIKALAPGLPLTYPLSGLLRCGECMRSMQPMSSRGASKSGKVYSYYRCPGASCGACTHKRYVDETWLREVVFSRLRERLFPPPESVGTVPDWFPGVVADIRAKSESHRPDARGQRAAIERELEELSRSLRGWSRTLANPDLPPAVRADIERDYAAAKDRVRDVETAMAEDAARAEHLDDALDPRRVLDELHRLSEVMSRMSPAALNIELAKHIAEICCHEDGRVVMRTTKVGLFQGITDLLNQPTRETRGDSDRSAGASTSEHITPRRRGKLRVPPDADASAVTKSHADVGLDPQRFAGLAGEFFWKDEFRAPERTCWSERHAMEVWRRKKDTGLSQNRLAKEYGVSRPTITRALRIAKERLRESTSESSESGDGEQKVS